MDRTPSSAAWLLLVHQLPPTPTGVRVKAWRRLQKVGAVTLKGSVFVLPNTAQGREDFEWIAADIVAMGGQACMLAADTVDPACNEEIVGAFRLSRQQEFESIRREAAGLVATLRRRQVKATQRRQIARQARAVRQRWDEVVSLDFFGAPGREDAGASVTELERMAQGIRKPDQSPKGAVLAPEAYRKRQWVTRPRPGIDRMASAWLIRRFIDPHARFVFSDSPTPGGVPFDMYGVEFSHQNGGCTFETLARRFGLSSPALQWLARIVHRLDLKDAAADDDDVPDAGVVGRLVDGLRQMHADDAVLLEQGIAMCEALYRSGATPPAQPAPRRARRRSP